MKIKLQHVPLIAQKVAIELNKSGIVTMTKGLEPVAAEASKILIESIKQEAALEEKVHDILDANEEAMDEQNVDDRQLFFMIKKKIAPEFGVILSYDDRFSDIAHKILDELYEEDLIHYDIEEIRIKNVIFGAITSFIADNDAIEDAVYEKIKTYQRKIIPGTDDYEILFEKLYREELTKRGMA
jgi:hypothetical protein